jgi:hypothetical protein
MKFRYDPRQVEAAAILLHRYNPRPYAFEGFVTVRLIAESLVRDIRRAVNEYGEDVMESGYTFIQTGGYSINIYRVVEELHDLEAEICIKPDILLLDNESFTTSEFEYTTEEIGGRNA